MLLGSSVAKRSASQAVQLASSLNALRGGGGGLNPLGKLRSAKGIDRLRILGSDKATGRGTALAAGQHLSDELNVEIITDARGVTATQARRRIVMGKAVEGSLNQGGGQHIIKKEKHEA